MSGNFGLLESGFAKKILVILFLALSIYLVNLFIAVMRVDGIAMFDLHKAMTLVPRIML